MKHLLRLLICALLPALLSAQLLDNASLDGDYYFVHLLINESGGSTTNVRNLGGTLSFDGAGGFTFTGQLGSGAAAPTADAGVGAYDVETNGFVTLTDPIDNALEINARLGAGLEAVIGATTETAGGEYGLFMAIQAPSGAVDNSVLSGSYTGGTFSFPGGNDAALATALLRLEPDGAGAFTTLMARGHAMNAGEVNIEEGIAGATYALAADGTGTAALGADSTLFMGARDVFVSANGNFLIGHSTEPGGREIFAAVRNFSDTADDADWSGNYWFAEVILDPEFGSFTAAAGGLVTFGAGVATISERLLSDRFTSDFSTVNVYEIKADSTGQLAPTLERDTINMGLGAPSGAKGAAGVPLAAVGAQVNALGTTSFLHGLFIAIRMPDLASDGVFLNPLGVINGASFAPTTFPIAAGTIVSLFGSGMAPPGTFTNATVTPLPTNLDGIVVTINGVPAPLFFVSPTQINAQVPFATAGNAALIVVANNGVASNTVSAPLAPTSPGIFSLALNGLGPGIIVDSLTFAPIDAGNPASEGQFVSIFLTGLGDLNPPIADGFPAPSTEPLARATDPDIQVIFGFIPESGVVTFAGGAPNFVGLYQINVIVPALTIVGASVPVAILTSNGLSDFVTIAIEF